MEGEQGGEGGGRRRKKSIRWRQAGEGTSTAAPDPPPVVPMEEEIVPTVGDEDEPVGPKKSELRSWLGWAVIRAIYNGLPDFQVRRLEGMGFGPFLRLEELAPNVALIQALKERWDPECHAFLFPWGHMVLTLDDVVRITGLRVDGQAVTGTTYTSYQEPVERLPGLAVRGERSSLVRRTVLQASLGVASARRQTGEGQAEYMDRMTEDARVAMAEEEGDAADRDLRRFLTLVIRKLILGTRGDPVGCRCLPLLEDLSSVGNYAWGAALLAHLFDSLGTSSRETVSRVSSHSYRCGHTTTSPPWAAEWRGDAARYLFYSAGDFAETSGLCGARYGGLPTSGRTMPPSRGWSGAVPTSVTDWTVWVQEQLDDWERRGKEVVSEATSDEDYFRAYARRYGAQVYKGIWRPLDPEGRIFSLEGVLHSTIQQRDDLQAVVDQLRAELDRAQQMVGGASSSREDPGRSVLEGQLASAAGVALAMTIFTLSPSGRYPGTLVAICLHLSAYEAKSSSDFIFSAMRS
ncbi:hypothetical protein Taro_002130, partial [Colocasia esculenta]|nr:hypothetical protein [Colocasia esculenta]